MRQQGLDEARARWEDAGITDYRLTYMQRAAQSVAVVENVVRAGKLERVWVDGLSQPPVDGADVEELFAGIQRFIDRHADELDVLYADAGYPLRIRTRPSPFGGDADYVLTVVELIEFDPID